MNLLKCPTTTDIQASVDNVIARYQSTFTPTNEVTFTSSCMPTKPQPKPGSRDKEKRLCKSGHVPKGSGRIARCSFCGSSSGPDSSHSTITSCRMYQKYGRRIASESEKNTLLRCINQICSNIQLTSYMHWPDSSHHQVIHDGFPTTGNHLVICGIYFITHGSTNRLVGDIQFLAEGGVPMIQYSHVPMSHVIGGCVKVNSKNAKDWRKETNNC